jgi:hypothetical protein
MQMHPMAGQRPKQAFQAPSDNAIYKSAQEQLIAAQVSALLQKTRTESAKQLTPRENESGYSGPQSPK